MKIGLKIRCLLRLLSVGCALLEVSTVANAEPALDRVLAGVQSLRQKSCTALKITFNLRVRYLSHFPLARGQELRISLRPIDGEVAAAEILTRRESLRPPETAFGRIKAIDFEALAAGGPALTFQFAEATNFEVSQGDDFQSVIVKLFGKGAPTSACTANFPSAGGIGEWSTSVTPSSNARLNDSAVVRLPKRQSGSATDEQTRSAAAMMDEGRAALRKGNPEAAIAKFRKVLALPETESAPEALELLGLAHQRQKNIAQARADYEEYLARYPSGEGADRVHQRLAGIVTADEPSSSKLKQAKSQSMADDGMRTWTVSGSLSQFYIRDDSFRTLRDPSLPPSVNEDLDAHETHQNQLLTSLDAIATWSGGGMKSKLRFSGTEEHKFDDDDEIVGVAALFAETSIRDWGTSARIGRQTRNTGGVLGRFDGGLFSFDLAQPFRLNAVVGSPVLRRRDEPFVDDRYFYGASLDIGPFDGFDFSIFAIEQRDRSVLDRRAVGAEARFVDADKSAFAAVDYDIHYQELNAAIVNGSWTLADKSTLHAAYDYRKSPYLSTWTALQGQVYPTLYEMLKVHTLNEVETFAVDRTASFTSASAGFARPIDETFQVSVDATMTNFSGTPASGGVGATNGTGNEYFVSSQLIGNGVFTPEDLLILGFRYADLDTSNYYVADLSFRYPLMDSLKINPRLMLGYRTGDTSDLLEYTILPSVLVDYYFTKDLSLELEVGARWTDLTENNVEETSTDLFFTIGYRYDFYADGQYETQSRAAPYGAGAPK